MNNRNWIAVFLGLACLVLFVSVMGSSGNWLTGNNDTNNNNGVMPQQVNQTVRDMNKAPKDGSAPTEIDSNNMTSGITNAAEGMKDMITDNNGNDSDTNKATSQMNMSQMR